LENVLEQFSGAPAILDHSLAGQTVSRGSIPPEKVEGAIEHLLRLSFLGVEIAPGSFVFSDESRELRRNLVLAHRYCEQTGSAPKYLINRAFRTFLRIVEPDDSL